MAYDAAGLLCPLFAAPSTSKGAAAGGGGGGGVRVYALSAGALEALEATSAELGKDVRGRLSRSRNGVLSAPREGGEVEEEEEEQGQGPGSRGPGGVSVDVASMPWSPFPGMPMGPMPFPSPSPWSPQGMHMGGGPGSARGAPFMPPSHMWWLQSPQGGGMAGGFPGLPSLPGIGGPLTGPSPTWGSSLGLKLSLDARGLSRAVLHDSDDDEQAAAAAAYALSQVKFSPTGPGHDMLGGLGSRSSEPKKKRAAPKKRARSTGGADKNAAEQTARPKGRGKGKGAVAPEPAAVASAKKKAGAAPLKKRSKKQEQQLVAEIAAQLVSSSKPPKKRGRTPVPSSRYK
jgi:hypothetical protein